MSHGPVAPRLACAPCQCQLHACSQEYPHQNVARTPDMMMAAFPDKFRIGSDEAGYFYEPAAQDRQTLHGVCV